MFRTFMTAAALILTMTAAQAGDTVNVHVADLDPASAKDAQILATRIHDAAGKACAAEVSRGALLNSFYGEILADCVDRSSKSAMTEYQALAKATGAARANLASK
jgi:UrcA family protein